MTTTPDPLPRPDWGEMNEALDAELDSQQREVARIEGQIRAVRGLMPADSEKEER